jgi:hypothetical protein
MGTEKFFQKNEKISPSPFFSSPFFSSPFFLFIYYFFGKI